MTSKQLLYVVMFTFIVTLIWVGSNIFHSRSEVQIPSETKQLMEPLSPNFDKEVIDGL